MSGQKNQPSDLQVIGFDLDNTLYPVTDLMQGRIRGRIYEKISAEIGISVPESKNLFEENYNGNFAWSHSGTRTIEEIRRMHSRKTEGSDIVQEALEEADILDFIMPNMPLSFMLDRISSRFYMDLITGSGIQLAAKKLERVGISAGIFGHIFCGGKTGGSAYEGWLEMRGVKPEEALYVGDNKKQDIDVPKSLGIRTCLVGKPYSNADYCIENILELEEVLRDL